MIVHIPSFFELVSSENTIGTQRNGHNVAADLSDSSEGLPLGVSDRLNSLFEANRNKVRIYGVVDTPQEIREEEGGFKWNGIAAYPNGTTVEGEFVGGSHVNKAQICTCNDLAFSGTVKNGKYEGYGTFVSSALVYNGQFVNDLPNGIGECTLADSSGEELSYHGEWTEGRAHGNGTISTTTEEYEGEWKHGKRHGNGVLRKRPTEVESFNVVYDNGEEQECINSKDELITQLKKTIDEQSHLCKVCFAEPATVVFIPCRHLCVCETCCERIRFKSREEERNLSSLGNAFKCVICRSIVNDVVYSIVVT